VVKTKRKHNRKKGAAKVLREEIIELAHVSENKSGKRQNGKRDKACLRRICYLDEQNRLFIFLTNNMKMAVGEVAILYKKR
jgi:hypothetical protein